MSEQNIACAIPEPKGIKRVWLSVRAMPDEKTKIQKLTIILELNSTPYKWLVDQYCVDGIILSDHNLSWLFNERDERIKELEAENQQLQMFKEAILEAIPEDERMVRDLDAKLSRAMEALEWYANWDWSDKYVQAVPTRARACLKELREGG